MTPATPANSHELFPAQTAADAAQDDAAEVFERQRAFIGAHQSALTPIKPGQLVTCSYRGTHRGIMLRLDDPRAWAGSLKFPFTSENNLPAQDEVTAHVANCIGQGLLTGNVPVAWYFGMVLWDAADRLDVAKDPTPNTEIFADRPHILKQLGRFAEEDMRLARTARDYEILIAQTRRGLVGLAYDPRTRIYTLTTQDGGSFRVSGKRPAIKVEIINLYDAQEAEEGEGEGRKAA